MKFDSKTLSAYIIFTVFLVSFLLISIFIIKSDKEGKRTSNSEISTVVASSLTNSDTSNLQSGSSISANSDVQNLNQVDSWTNCNSDIYCAETKAGISFPIKVTGDNIRAKNGVIEINLPLDDNREVAIRKKLDSKNGDITEVSIDYPVGDIINYEKDIEVHVKGTYDKVNKIYFKTDVGYYSAYSKAGMKAEETFGVYKLIRESEGVNNITLENSDMHPSN